MWGEEFEFNLTNSAQAVLVITVMDKSEPLGYYSLPVSQKKKQKKKQKNKKQTNKLTLPKHHLKKTQTKTSLKKGCRSIFLMLPT